MVMAYKKIKSYELTEAEMRKIWADEYCTEEIFTFDEIRVQFYSEMYNH
jgi:hypothetical protein